jgi:hypothetical protein
MLILWSSLKVLGFELFSLIFFRLTFMFPEIWIAESTIVRQQQCRSGSSLTRCQFHQHFMKSFFTKSLMHSISDLKVCACSLRHNDNGRKMFLNMLVQMTKGFSFHERSSTTWNNHTGKWLGFQTAKSQCQGGMEKDLGEWVERSNCLG